MIIPDLKKMLEEILDDMDYYKVDKLEDFPRLSDIYQNVYPLDNIEINFALTKDSEKNILEVVAFQDNDDGTRSICRAYEEYSNIIMMMKNSEFDLKVFVGYIIERIKKSFEINYKRM